MLEAKGASGTKIVIELNTFHVIILITQPCMRFAKKMASGVSEDCLRVEHESRDVFEKTEVETP